MNTTRERAAEVALLTVENLCTLHEGSLAVVELGWVNTLLDLIAAHPSHKSDSLRHAAARCLACIVQRNAQAVGHVWSRDGMRTCVQSAETELIVTLLLFGGKHARVLYADAVQWRCASNALCDCVRVAREGAEQVIKHCENEVGAYVEKLARRFEESPLKSSKNAGTDDATQTNRQAVVQARDVLVSEGGVTAAVVMHDLPAVSQHAALQQQSEHYAVNVAGNDLQRSVSGGVASGHVRMHATLSTKSSSSAAAMFVLSALVRAGLDVQAQTVINIVSILHAQISYNHEDKSDSWSSSKGVQSQDTSDGQRGSRVEDSDSDTAFDIPRPGARDGATDEQTAGVYDQRIAIACMEVLGCACVKWRQDMLPAAKLLVRAMDSPGAKTRTEDDRHSWNEAGNVCAELGRPSVPAGRDCIHTTAARIVQKVSSMSTGARSALFQSGAVRALVSMCRNGAKTCCFGGSVRVRSVCVEALASLLGDAQVLVCMYASCAARM
jgi:hypothetical protein